MSVSSQTESYSAMLYERGEEFALRADRNDKLAHFREKFIFPQSGIAGKTIYFAGNSLGLQPKRLKNISSKSCPTGANLL